ncbi:MCE family protein [Qaidamihabitans albus]|uniref:MCE family protein n=1 Tax=Qaidamihabitans albus TaxID=2795733 RepID=UPI0018F1EDDE|nr:MCE family protein [Qaidamihabitans albus]
MKRRQAGLFGTLLLVVVTATGCGYRGPLSLPLPGAIDGEDTYRVTVTFDDATNLVPKQTCRANDTVVGSVESVTLDQNLDARVVCAVKDSVTLPANSVGTLAETSLLGERYVAIGPAPGEEPQGKLAPASAVPVGRMQASPSTEQVLGALSAVLNGGSIGRIHQITRELNNALDGRTADIPRLLGELNQLTGTLNRHRGDITHALDSLDNLSTKLADQRDTIGATLDTIPAGINVLNRQRPKLTATLLQLDRLSSVAEPLIDRSKENVVADLEHLRPVLAELSKNGREIAGALEIAVSYPFPKNTQSVIEGDYGGLFGRINIDADTINELLRQELSALARRQEVRTDSPGSAPAPAPALAPAPRLPDVLDDLIGAAPSLVGEAGDGALPLDLGQLLLGGPS